MHVLGCVTNFEQRSPPSCTNVMNGIIFRPFVVLLFVIFFWPVLL